MKRGYAGKRRGRRTRGRRGGMRLEENTKWIVGGGEELEVVVLTLHSFVYPPEPSNRPAVTQGLILLPLEA